MSNSSFYSLMMLSIVTYLCCVGLFVGNRLKMNRLEKKLVAVEQTLNCLTNSVQNITVQVKE